MVWVTLGLGSSVDANNQITLCLDDLLLNFKDLSLSNVFESDSVGFEGDSFLNMVVGFDTDLSLPDLSALIKKIEDKIGVDRSKPRFSPRKIDIDLLTYDNYQGNKYGIKLPRPELIENAYVLWPMSQVSANKKHPVLKRSYGSLWKSFYTDKIREDVQKKLKPINFTWHGRKISRSK